VLLGGVSSPIGGKAILKKLDNKTEMRYKVLFVIISLGGGGAENSLVQILAYLNREIFTPSLVIFEKHLDYIEHVPRDIPIYCLEKRRALDFFKLVVRLIRVLKYEDPDVLVSFMIYADIITYLAKVVGNLKCKIVLSVRNNIIKSLKFQRFNKLKKILLYLAYRNADGIIAISKGLKKIVCDNFKVNPMRCHVIYNPIDVHKIKKLSSENFPTREWPDIKGRIVVGMGRLEDQKRFDLLIEAVTHVNTYLPVNLVILGKGKKLNELKNKADCLHIGQRVHFVGFKKNPFPWIARGDVFVISSDFEGFGRVVAEAMAVGIPVISTRCNSGPDEIITDGISGLLVPVGNVEAIAGAIVKVLKNGRLRKRLAEAGRMRAEFFSAEKIVAQYEKVFKEVIRE